MSGRNDDPVSPQALADAARPVRERVLSDAEAAPEPLAGALRSFAERLLETHKTTAELERLCGLNAIEPARSFAEHFGVTPKVYFAERRLEIAAPLLRSHRIESYRIGYAVGFPSPSSFGAAFKRRFGLTPSAYQRAEPPTPSPDVIERELAQILGELTRREPIPALDQRTITEASDANQNLPEDRPMPTRSMTHHDLATLFASADTAESSPMRALLLTMVSHEPFAQLYRDLEQMAEDAGISRRLEGWELDAVTDNQAFDRLLEASGWDDVAAVLDPNGGANLDYETLLRICEARKRRGAGERARLEAIEHKLRAKAAQERRLFERRREAETQLLESLAAHIREPEAMVVFTRLAAELRSLLDQFERKVLAAAQQPAAISAPSKTSWGTES